MKIKEMLMLWRNIKRMESKKDNLGMTEESKENLTSQKEACVNVVIPDENIMNSEIYINVVLAYRNWIAQIEGPEYFVDSLNTLYKAVGKEEIDAFSFFIEGSQTMLAKIFSRFQELECKDGKYTIDEQYFLGAFRHCFPNKDVFHQAREFFKAFTFYMKTFHVLNIEDLNVVEIAEVGDVLFQQYMKNCIQYDKVKLERKI